MPGRRACAVVLVVLAVAGCNRGGGGGGGGGLSNAGLRVAVTAQPANAVVDQPISFTVQLLDQNNQPAAVSTNATVSIVGSSIGLVPRTVTGTIPPQASSAVLSAQIAAVGTYALTVTVTTQAGPITGQAVITVSDNAFAGTTSSEVQIDTGGPGIATYSSIAGTSAVDSQVAFAFCDQRLQATSHVFLNGSLTGGATFLGPNQVDHAPAGADAWDASTGVDGQGFVVIGWCDQQVFETGAVFANVSSDGGVTFLASDTRVDAATVRVGPCSGTRSAVSVGQVFVAWVDARDASGASVYVARSLDQGHTFTETRLDTHTAGATPWTVATPIGLVASGGDVSVLWVETQGATTNVVVASSQNGGASFTNTTLNGAPAANVQDARLVASGGALYVAWRDNRAGPAFGVFERRSIDGGATWIAEVSVALGAAKAQVSSLSLAGAGPDVVVLVASQDQGATQVVPLVSLSGDGGQTFTSLGPIPQGTVDSVRDPEASASGFGVYASWNETTYASGERASVSTNGGTTFSTAGKISASTAADGLFGPSRRVLSGGGHFYVLWEEARGTPSSASHLYFVVFQ